MPIYEYMCDKCGSRIEIIQKIGDPPPKRCQKCRGKLNKVVSRTSFQLKGSGWYATDYSSRKDASAGKSKSDTAAEKKSETDKKSETASTTAASSEGD